MLKLDFTTEQIQALKYERFHHPHSRVQRKMEALFLKSQNLPHSLICELVGISANTLRNYFRAFQTGGVEALKELDFYRPTSPAGDSQRVFRRTFQTIPRNERRAGASRNRKTHRNPALTDTNPLVSSQTR